MQVRENARKRRGERNQEKSVIIIENLETRGQNREIEREIDTEMDVSKNNTGEKKTGIGKKLEEKADK